MCQGMAAPRVRLPAMHTNVFAARTWLRSTCAAIVFLAGSCGSASAREPWPYNMATVPERAFEPLPTPPGNSVIAPPGSPVTELQPELGTCCSLPECCPNHRLYAIFDALVITRYNAFVDRPLAFNTNTGATVLNTQDLQWPVAPGVRVAFGERGANHCGWEVGYLGVYSMYSSAQASANGALSAPGDLGLNAPPFNGANLMQLSYASTLNMAEANVFKYDCYGGMSCGRDPCGKACNSCCCVDWLGGFRWAGLNESANLTATSSDLSQTSVYGVSTNTNMFGGQVGFRGRRDSERWGVEGCVKAGLAGVWMSQSQAPIVNTVTGLNYRDASASTATGLGGFTDVSGSVIYRLNRMWGLRAGLDAIWLGNVALAPDQWDFNQTSAVTSIDNGGLFLLGGHLGAEARW